ncbi:hypothetical protein HK12_07365 [Acetobacter orientalis]|uniref:Uncharacterized protein n=1 Tax=Acetobacter orientalis TaxID=146474 RepID=A0A252A147_9PROT|nr:hypothetical protein HK12_07365 [Acetobacter orientalis]
MKRISYISAFPTFSYELIWVEIWEGKKINKVVKWCAHNIEYIMKLIFLIIFLFRYSKMLSVTLLGCIYIFALFEGGFFAASVRCA